MLYEMLTLRAPFVGSNIGALVRRISRGKYQRLTHSQSATPCGELVEELLSLRPSERPSAKRILLRPFAKNRLSIFERNRSSFEVSDVTNGPRTQHAGRTNRGHATRPRRALDDRSTPPPHVANRRRNARTPLRGAPKRDGRRIRRGVPLPTAPPDDTPSYARRTIVQNDAAAVAVTKRSESTSSARSKRAKARRDMYEEATKRQQSLTERRRRFFAERREKKATERDRLLEHRRRHQAAKQRGSHLASFIRHRRQAIRAQQSEEKEIVTVATPSWVKIASPESSMTSSSRCAESSTTLSRSLDASIISVMSDVDESLPDTKETTACDIERASRVVARKKREKKISRRCANAPITATLQCSLLSDIDAHDHMTTENVHDNGHTMRSTIRAHRAPRLDVSTTANGQVKTDVSERRTARTVSTSNKNDTVNLLGRMKRERAEALQREREMREELRAMKHAAQRQEKELERLKCAVVQSSSPVVPSFSVATKTIRSHLVRDGIPVRSAIRFSPLSRLDSFVPFSQNS